MNLNTHPVPEHIARLVTDKGGSAPNGQPLFRLIWGGDRMTIIGGEWKKFDSSGNETGSIIEEKLTHKYVGAEERFILEMWCPSENYGTPEEWEERTTRYIDGKKVRELGPFPRNGEYEMVKVLETPTKRAFVPLTATVVDAILAVAVANRHLPHDIRMAAFRDRQERERVGKIAKRAMMIDNMGLAFEGREHVIVPQNYGKVTLT